MLRYTFNEEETATRIESAVRKVLADGYRTADIYEHVACHYYIELPGIAHELHCGIIDQHVGKLHFRERFPVSVTTSRQSWVHSSTFILSTEQSFRLRLTAARNPTRAILRISASLYIMVLKPTRWLSRHSIPRGSPK